MENLYIDGILYHQRLVDKKPKVKALLEDYSFLIAALISAYETGFDEKYLTLAKKFNDEAFTKFFSRNSWYMSDDEFKMISHFEDNAYRSAAAVMVENILNLAALTNNPELNSIAEKILKENSYLLDRNPGNYPYLLKAYLRYKKGNIIIKSTKENLLKAKVKIESIGYPFIRYKVEESQKYQACTMQSCFAIEDSLEKLIENVKGY